MAAISDRFDAVTCGYEAENGEHGWCDGGHLVYDCLANKSFITFQEIGAPLKYLVWYLDDGVVY